MPSRKRMKRPEVEVNPAGVVRGIFFFYLLFATGFRLVIHLLIVNHFLFFRSSSNSLTSQRTSNTSLASQRTSNNSLAGSLRSRGLQLCPAAATSKGNFRLELNAEEETVATTAAAATAAPEVPAPFPTTSNIGLGLRSPPSGLNSGLTSGRTTPCSVSPTSPMTPSSPGSSPQQQVGQLPPAIQFESSRFN